MLWMIAAWTGFINETKSNSEVLFLYQGPMPKDSITLQYTVHFIKELWGWYEQ